MMYPKADYMYLCINLHPYNSKLNAPALVKVNLEYFGLRSKVTFSRLTTM